MIIAINGVVQQSFNFIHTGNALIFFKKYLKTIFFAILRFSINSACKEQSLCLFRSQLSSAIPSLADQYTSFVINSKYLLCKVRTLHAFQISLVVDAVSLLGKNSTIYIVDIGDSSGVHLQYINSIFLNEHIESLSVNLDPVAVNKIRKKGLRAIESSAESLHVHPDFKKRTDVFLSFEMLEHLVDPIGFLRKMFLFSDCQYFVITVPLLNKSRGYLQQARKPFAVDSFSAEVTHIFELSADDWDAIFRFSGWKIVKSSKYLQYPTKNPLVLLKHVWKKFDFLGFYGVILEKDDSITNLYKDWQ